MATYSINNGTAYESTFLGNLDPNLFLNQLPNNTSQLIVPEDVRDSLYTIWDNVTFKQVTAPTTTVEYIGISGNVHSDNYDNGADGLKILIGKPDLSGTSIMDQELIEYNSGNVNYPDSDIILYNFKPDNYGGGGSDQQFTKISFLAGDPANNLFNTAPYMLSQENSGGTAIDLTIFNEGGKITLDSADELIIGSPNTKITLLYGTGSTGIKTLPAGNPGDVQINLDDCEFGAVNGASSSLGDILIMGASNSPYWGSLSINSVFTLNQTLGAGNTTSGEDIILTVDDSLYVGGTGSTYGRIYNDNSKTYISTTGELEISASTLRLGITGIGANKALYTDGSGNAYWGTQSVGGGGGTPGGSNTQIQYNNSGSFAGSSLLIWNNTLGSMRINGASNNRALSIKANAGGGLQVDTNDTDAGFQVLDTGGMVFKIRTDVGNKAITFDQSSIYKFVWGGDNSQIFNRYTFINTTESENKHFTLKETQSGENFRIDFNNGNGETASMINFGPYDSYGVQLSTLDTQGAGVVLGSHDSSLTLNPSLIVYPGTVSQSDLGLETSKVPVLVGSGNIGGATEGTVLLGDEKRALGVNIVPEVDFHLSGMEANLPESVSLIFYGPLYSIGSTLSSSIIMLDNSGDSGRIIGRIGNNVGIQSATFGTKLKVINRAGNMIISALNPVLGSGTPDVSRRNIYIPEHYGLTSSGPLPYDASSDVQFSIGQVLEMVYLPLGGVFSSFLAGVTDLVNEGGYWHVTSLT